MPLAQSTETNVIITKVDVYVYRVPIDRPVATSFGVMTNRPAVFVRIEDADGIFGWGEIFANWPASGAEHRARLLIEDMADLVIGATLYHPADLFYALDKATHIRALQCGEWGPFSHVIAGLDIAVYDLFARRAGIPVRTFLNAAALGFVPAYASGIHIKEAHDVIEQSRYGGFNAFKVKVGFDLESDVSQLRDIARTITNGEKLFADANQAWDADTALIFANDTRECNLGWLEEPIPADAPPEEWKRLASGAIVPIAGGENISGFEDFDQAINSEIFKFIQPDVAKWGGFTGCLAVAKLAQIHGRTYCPHFLGGGIGLTASAHLLAAVGGDGLLEVDANPNPLRDAFEQVKSQQGVNGWALGDAVGLGITEIPSELSTYQTLYLHTEI